jgi:hypothetical protein
MDNMRTAAATATATFSIGDRVRATAWNGSSRLVTIEDIGDKDGRVVYDLSDGHWAYASQLSRVR